MSIKRASPWEKGSKAAAVAAGAGGGALLEFIEGSLPQGNRLKPLLRWAVPFVAGFLAVAWLWLQVQVARYLRDCEISWKLRNTLKRIEEARNNPTLEADWAPTIRAFAKVVQSDIYRRLREIESLIVTEEVSSPDNRPPRQNSDKAASTDRPHSAFHINRARLK